MRAGGVCVGEGGGGHVRNRVLMDWNAVTLKTFDLGPPKKSFRLSPTGLQEDTVSLTCSVLCGLKFEFHLYTVSRMGTGVKLLGEPTATVALSVTANECLKLVKHHASLPWSCLAYFHSPSICYYLSEKKISHDHDWNMWNNIFIFKSKALLGYIIVYIAVTPCLSFCINS